MAVAVMVALAGAHAGGASSWTVAASDATPQYYTTTRCLGLAGPKGYLSLSIGAVQCWYP